MYSIYMEAGGSVPGITLSCTQPWIAICNGLFNPISRGVKNFDDKITRVLARLANGGFWRPRIAS